MKYKYKEMRVKKKENNDVYNTAYTLTKAKEKITFLHCHSSLFYFHRAKNVRLQIFLAVEYRYKTKQNHPWDGVA